MRYEIEEKQLTSIINTWQETNYPDIPNLKGYLDALERCYRGKYSVNLATMIINKELYDIDTEITSVYDEEGELKYNAKEVLNNSTYSLEVILQQIIDKNPEINLSELKTHFDYTINSVIAEATIKRGIRLRKQYDKTFNIGDTIVHTSDDTRKLLCDFTITACSYDRYYDAYGSYIQYKDISRYKLKGE